MRYDDAFLEQVRNATDIVEVIGPYVKLKKKGQNWFGLCPFHNEKSPSFSVQRERGMYYCFGCGAGGNAITFLMEHDGMEFQVAVEELARRAGIPLPERSAAPADRSRDRLRDALEAAAAWYEQQLRGETGKPAVAYLKGRGITGQTAKTYRLGVAPDAWDGLLKHLTARGYSPKELLQAGLLKQREKGDGHYDAFRNRLIFPFLDRRGRVIGFGGRTLDPKEESGPKYLNSPETPFYQKGRVLYGLPQAVGTLLKEERALLVEGQFDVLSLHQAGFEGTVAASGTAFTADQARILKRLVKKVLLLFDADAAGLKAAFRSYEGLVKEGLEVGFVPMPAGEDPDTLVRAEGPEAFRARLHGALSVVPFYFQHLDPPLAMRDVGGRADAARGALDLLRHDSDGLRQAMSLQQVAGIVGLDEGTLRGEMQALEKERGRFEDPTETPQKGPAPPPGRMEGEFFRLLLEDTGFRRTALERVQAEDFADGRLRELLGLVQERMDPSGALDLNGLMEAARPGARSLLAALLQSEGEPGAERPDALGEELLHGIEGRRLKERRRRLKASMEQARLAGDEETLERLLKEYQEIHQ